MLTTPVESCLDCYACAGGKDSTVLAHLLTLLNERHSYGLRLFLLSIDEGITGTAMHCLPTYMQHKQDCTCIVQCTCQECTVCSQNALLSYEEHLSSQMSLCGICHTSMYMVHVKVSLTAVGSKASA